VSDEQERLATVVRAQAESREAWEWAELCCVESVLRERLAELRVDVSPDVAVAIMATAMLLAERAPEWGGDSRDVLADLALLGLNLLAGE
jgi:hypothetical protein